MKPRQGVGETRWEDTLSREGPFLAEELMAEFHHICEPAWHRSGLPPPECPLSGSPGKLTFLLQIKSDLPCLIVSLLGGGGGNKPFFVILFKNRFFKVEIPEFGRKFKREERMCREK